MLCEITADSGALIGSLRDLNVFDHLKSDAEKFEAQLKPVTFESGLMIQTKIELIRNCDSWEMIAEAVSSKQEDVLVVNLMSTDSLEAVS